MEREQNRLRKLSQEILHELTNEQNILQEIYLELAKRASHEASSRNLDTDVEQELADLKRTATNLNKAQKLTNRMHDELKARHKDSSNDHCPSNTEIDYKEAKYASFAKGLNIYKILLILIIGSFCGVIIEMLFCLFKNGYLESRTCTVIGPFNIVYGLGAVCLTLFLYKYRNRGVHLSFFGGMLIGSAVEYACSYFQELLFGSTSWNYSSLPLNLNGRICLLYSLFWGFLGVWWIKVLYPLIAKLILKLPDHLGKALTIALAIFLILDFGLSSLVVYRWKQRLQSIPANNAIAKKLDELYPNWKLKKIYPNLVFKK